MQKTYDPVITALRNPYNAGHHAQGLINAIPGYLNSARNMDRKQMVGVLIIIAEVIGFFTVGEMLGKMKIVGYSGPGSQTQHPVTDH
jgi:F-type H+-transporting ATPase subunit g